MARPARECLAKDVPGSACRSSTAWTIEQLWVTPAMRAAGVDFALSISVINGRDCDVRFGPVRSMFLTALSRLTRHAG